MHVTTCIWKNLQNIGGGSGRNTLCSLPALSVVEREAKGAPRQLEIHSDGSLKYQRKSGTTMHVTTCIWRNLEKYRGGSPGQPGLLYQFRGETLLSSGDQLLHLWHGDKTNPSPSARKSSPLPPIQYFFELNPPENKRENIIAFRVACLSRTAMWPAPIDTDRWRSYWRSALRPAGVVPG
jgi:hypothetical protein